MKEFDALQSAIRDYDKTIFTIKGWAITVFSASIFFIAREDEPAYVLLAALAVLLFWALDAIYKSFQQRFLDRYKLIEAYLRNHLIEAIDSRSISLPFPDLNSRHPDGTRPLLPWAWRAAKLWQTKALYLAMLVMLALIAVFEAISS